MKTLYDDFYEDLINLVQGVIRVELPNIFTEAFLNDLCDDLDNHLRNDVESALDIYLSVGKPLNTREYASLYDSLRFAVGNQFNVSLERLIYRQVEGHMSVKLEERLETPVDALLGKHFGKANDDDE